MRTTQGPRNSGTTPNFAVAALYDFRQGANRASALNYNSTFFSFLLNFVWLFDVGADGVEESCPAARADYLCPNLKRYSLKIELTDQITCSRPGSMFLDTVVVHTVLRTNDRSTRGFHGWCK